MKKHKTNEEIAEEVSLGFVSKKRTTKYIREGFDRKDIVKAILRAFEIKKR